MTIHIPRKWGLPGILESLRVIQRLDAKYRAVILRFLDTEERLRYLAIMEAINLFVNALPIDDET